MACSVFEPSTTTDEDLIQRVRDHDDGPAFETLVHRYERELYGFLRRYLNDAELELENAARAWATSGSSSWATP